MGLWLISIAFVEGTGNPNISSSEKSMPADNNILSRVQRG